MRQLKITTSITNRESRSVELYLQEMAKISMVTLEEEIELTRKIYDGDQRALEKFVKANLRFVVSVAKQYQHQGLSLSDLINEGNLGLIKAAQRFDPSRGFKFISYAVRWIRQSILQALSEQGRIVRLPLNKIALNKKINNTFISLTQEYEREPSDEEIAAALDLEPEVVAAGLAAYGYHDSLDANFDAEDERTPYDVTPAEDEAKTMEHLEDLSIREIFLRLFQSLDDKTRDIMNHFFPIEPERYLDEEQLGKKHNIAKERARQIKDQLVKKLKGSQGNILRASLLGETIRYEIIEIINEPFRVVDKTIGQNNNSSYSRPGYKTPKNKLGAYDTHDILQEDPTPYAFITTDDLEHITHTPALPFPLQGKKYTKTVQGLIMLARYAHHKHKEIKRFACTIEVLKNIIGLPMEDTGSNTINGLYSFFEEQLSQKSIDGKAAAPCIIKSGEIHRAGKNKLLRIADVSFTDEFLEYLSTAKTFMKKDICHFSNKYTQKLFYMLLPHKDLSPVIYTLEELEKELDTGVSPGVASLYQRNSQKVHLIPKIVHNINIHSSLNIQYTFTNKKGEPAMTFCVKTDTKKTMKNVRKDTSTSLLETLPAPQDLGEISIMEPIDIIPPENTEE